jgi:hypothetical protein
MNFWKIYYNIKYCFFSLANKIIKLDFFLFQIEKKKILKKTIEIKNKFKDQQWIILGNSPALNNIDLKKISKKNIICMNRAYLLKEYELLKPKYHIIIDNKFYIGDWGNDIIDEILKLNPNVVFVFNVKWIGNKYFKDRIIKEKKIKIIWIDNRLFLNKYEIKNLEIKLTQPTYGGAVFGAALSFLAYGNAKSIIFTGVEANGLCYELIENRASHFYGSNLDNKKKNITDYINDLDQMSITLNQYKYWSKYFKEKNIPIYNCTGAGILKMFEEKNIDEVLK